MSAAPRSLALDALRGSAVALMHLVNNPGREAAYPADVRPAAQRAEVHFAHKTGTPGNDASGAGIVLALAPWLEASA